MGELFRYRGIKYAIEDTIKENNREKEHIHIYDKDNNRFQAFFDKKRRSFYFDEKKTPRRVRKAALGILNDNYDSIESQYKNAMNGRKVNKITFRR